MEAAQMMLETQRKRANPSARMSMLYSAFGEVSDASVEATLGGSAAASWPEDISFSDTYGAQAVRGLTAAEYRRKARSNMIATWQMPAIPLFFAATRNAAKACAASLSEHITIHRIVKVCNQNKDRLRYP